MFFSSKKEEAPLQVDITTFECIDPTQQYTFTDTMLLNTHYSIDNEENNDTEESKENNDTEESKETIEDVEKYDDEDEEESDIEEDTENTIYVICIDDVPSLYKKNLQEAKEKIDQMAKLYNLKDIGYHNTLTNYKSETEIEIIRNFDFGLFSLNFNMHTFKIFRLNN